MTLLQFIDYFRNYAIIHKSLKYNIADNHTGSFMGLFTQDGADDYVRNNSSKLLMMVLPYGKSMMPVRASNYNWDKAGCFLILKQCGVEQPAILQAQDECEQIADDFITRMVADRHTKIRGLNLESIHMEPVGPVADDRYGYICMFQMTDEFNEEVDPDRWTA